MPGAVTHRPQRLPDFFPLPRDPAQLPSPAGWSPPAPSTRGPRQGISSGALIPPPPGITQLSILYTTLGLPPSTRQKKHHSSDRPELTTFLSAPLSGEARGEIMGHGTICSSLRDLGYTREVGVAGWDEGRPRVLGAVFGWGIVLLLPLLSRLVCTFCSFIVFWELLDVCRL